MAGSAPLRRLPRLALYAAAAVALLAAVWGLLWISLPDPAPLARTNPTTTALIEQRKAESAAHRRALRVRRSWVGLERIPRHLVDAVILSEDAKFWGHEGIDWEATREAAQHDLARGKALRGGSTITQQLAKNLWLGTQKSLWRKAKEAILASKLERRLTKRRILALYLNVVELDEGVFGVEAGARARFGVPAASLTAAQSVVLASMLPAPRKVSLDHPSSWLKLRSRRLLERMRGAGRLGPWEYERARAELERILAGPVPPDDVQEPPEEEAPVASAPEPAARDAAGVPSAPPAATAPTPGPEDAPADPAPASATQP